MKMISTSLLEWREGQVGNNIDYLGQNFYGIFISDLRSGGREKKL